MLNAVVNIKGGRAKWLVFCCWWTCADSELRRFVEKTYAEEVQVHEILSVDVKETHGEETHRVMLTSCIHVLLALV